MGGDHTPDNIGLLCPQHNRSMAERDYGKAAIRRHVSPGGASLGPPPRPD
jgi:hypothetical protein